MICYFVRILFSFQNLSKIFFAKYLVYILVVVCYAGFYFTAALLLLSCWPLP